MSLVPHWQGLGCLAPAARKTWSNMVKDGQTLPNMVWCLEVVFFDTHHMMKTEKPTKTRKVQLIPIMANVQKLISPSPETELDIKIFI